MCAMKRIQRQPSPRARVGKFDVTLTVGDRDFTFPLNCQLRNLATDIQITYYWIDHRLLRETTLNQAHNVCRRIVDYWEQVLFLHDPSRAHSPSEVLVLAHAFRVLSRKKKMHQVFRDATLRPLPPRGSDFRDRAIDLRWAELADDVRQRIEAVVVQRDSNAVRRECAFIFGWNPPSSIELALLNQAYDQWVERAVELYRSRPEAGIEQFVDEFCRTESRLRRSGRTSFIARRFLDLMMFESKVSFYECYAVLWQGLIPWLRVNRNLDAVSEKFLRLWHNQNPSIRRAVANGVERFEADAFFGHVLSLHPLSGILMNSPGLCEQTATYFRISNEENDYSNRHCPLPQNIGIWFGQYSWQGISTD
jgi:hypothetical protein